jgi:hypothetical protein
MSVIERIDRKARRAYEAQAMECRATRHWMQRQESAPVDWNAPPGWRGTKHIIHYECQRCGTWRHIAIDHIGTLLASAYVWPDWYRRNGEERITPAELRLWMVKETARERRTRRTS